MTIFEKERINILKAEGKTLTEISRITEIPINTIKSYIRRKSVNVETCPVCGAELFHREQKKKKKFCSDKCRQKYWRESKKRTAAMLEITCKGCGKKFYAHQSKNRKYCSRLCYRGGVVNGK